LVREPERFDVILATNFYGDILSDLASELSGSIGLAGSMMANDVMCCAQAQHGSAPTLAGKDVANPVSMILSVGMMLAWLGKRHGRQDLEQAATLIDRSVDAVLENPAHRTADLGGTMRCRAFAQLVAQQVAAV
jgi:3-isopropylmalate dehydrogenase